MTVPTAHAATRDLLSSLSRAGWGDLSGREHHGTRAVLAALVNKLPYGSGTGAVTIAQVAQAAGYSPRWVATRLEELEALGLIEWHRGGVIAGRPRPSLVRIVKRALVSLIRAARPLKDAADAARAGATRARIAHLRYVRGRSHRSVHVEVTANPLTLRGGNTPLPVPGNVIPTAERTPEHRETYSRGAAAARAALETARRARQ